MLKLPQAEQFNEFEQFLNLTPTKKRWMKDNIGFEVMKYPVRSKQS
ncbi:MAG: hypothetical protein WCE21_04925 [Candidatus Babeliales bacterium]